MSSLSHPLTTLHALLDTIFCCGGPHTDGLVFYAAVESHRVAGYQCIHHYRHPCGCPAQRGLFCLSESPTRRHALLQCRDKPPTELQELSRSRLSLVKECTPQTWDVQVTCILTPTHTVDRQLKAETVQAHVTAPQRAQKINGR